MTDESKLRYQAERGRRAREILDDDATKDAFRAIEAHLFQQWASTDISETERREQLFGLYQSHLQYREMLSRALTNGKLAEDDLKQRHNTQ